MRPPVLCKYYLQSREEVGAAAFTKNSGVRFGWKDRQSFFLASIACRLLGPRLGRVQERFLATGKRMPHFSLSGAGGETPPLPGHPQVIPTNYQAPQ